MHKKHALTEVLSFSNRFIYKEKCGTVTKINECLKLNHKTVSYESLLSKV